MGIRTIGRRFLQIAVAGLLIYQVAVAQTTRPLFTVTMGAQQIEWTPATTCSGAIGVGLPDGSVWRREFAPGTTPAFGLKDDAGKTRAGGLYRYEIRVVPVLSAAARAALAGVREKPDREAAIERLRAQGILPRQIPVVFGTFSIRNGAFVSPAATEPAGTTVKTATTSGSTKPLGDIVQADDVIIQGSLAVGLDAINNENFGFDTIILKENNLRIFFNDTSAATGFPAWDWRLIANDSPSGGANYFAIADATSSTVPLKIEASAPTASLYVNSRGRIGLGTSNPLLKLQLTQGDTPAIRLDQDNTGGFTPQTWDVAGNEANFFVRDVTGGSKLPFRIQPGAPSGALSVLATNRIGMGTWVPDAALELRRADGTAQVLIRDLDPTTLTRTMLVMENNGGVQFQARDIDSGTTWTCQFNANEFSVGAGATPALRVGRNGTLSLNSWTIKTAGNQLWFTRGATTALKVDDAGNMILNGWTCKFAGGGVSFLNGAAEVAKLDGNGNLLINGTLTESSNVNAKENIRQVNGREMLERLAAVPIATWNFKNESREVKHVGPMAQDFHAAFGLSPDDQHIAPLDANGVALAAIKELDKSLKDREAEITALQTRLAAMEGAMQKLTARQSK